MCEAGRGVFEDIDVHDENNEVSGKLEAVGELNDVYLPWLWIFSWLCLILLKNTFFGP